MGYTILDSGANQDPATVFIAVNDMIWFVDNLVRGLTAGNASGSSIAGSGVGTLTISEVIVNNTIGSGIEVTNGTLAVALESLATTSSVDEGIDLTISNTDLSNIQVACQSMVVGMVQQAVICT